MVSWTQSEPEHTSNVPGVEVGVSNGLEERLGTETLGAEETLDVEETLGLVTGDLEISTGEGNNDAGMVGSLRIE